MPVGTSAFVLKMLSAVYNGSMPSRAAKQLMYGGLYLLIIVGFSYGFYLVKLKPAPTCFDNVRNQNEVEVDCGGTCKPCELKRLTPIKVSSVQVFDTGGRTSTAFVEFRNPNLTYGARQFVYDLSFYNAAGERFFSAPRRSFIAPGEIKFSVEFGIEADPRKIIRGEAKIREDEMVWESREKFVVPQFDTREIRIERKPETEQVVVSGILVNKSAFPLTRATVHLAVSNSFGIIVGVSKTQLQDVAAQSDRSFRVTVSGIVESADIDERSVRIYMEGER